MKKMYKVSDGKLYVEDRQPCERIDLGPCYFCHMSVTSAPGMAVTRLRGIPTHKSCRKNAGKV